MDCKTGEFSTDVLGILRPVLTLRHQVVIKNILVLTYGVICESSFRIDKEHSYKISNSSLWGLFDRASLNKKQITLFLNFSLRLAINGLSFSGAINVV
jgi:hypothetical protein